MIRPPSLCWLEYKLSEYELEYIQHCIKSIDRDSPTDTSIGKGHMLSDESDWFWKNTLIFLCEEYSKEFSNVGDNIPTTQFHPYYLHSWWVNYQKQNQFVPSHNHAGVYSFTIWLDIPTDYSEQNKNVPQVPGSHVPLLTTESSAVSSFEFQYNDLLGQTKSYTYKLSPEYNGTMVFFPSKLYHQVYPFYNSEGTRVSIAGNIAMDTSKVL